MNTKQFISSVIFQGVDWGVSRVPIIGRVISLPFRIVFPTMAYERVPASAMRLGTFVTVYVSAVLFCFVLQAYLAWTEGKLGTLDLTFNAAPPAGERILFLDDPHNLANYLLIVPLYLVTGTGYMISLFSLRERMAPLAGGYGFMLDDQIRPMLSGVAAVTAFLTLLIFTQSQYAIDMHERSDHLFWFHGETRQSVLTRNGYAYVAINTFLASFIILVALLHLELFRWSRILAHGIRTYRATDPESENLFTHSGDRLKEFFSPFTETAIWSKAFAMVLAINIYTWKASGVSGGSGAFGFGADGVDENSWYFRFIFVLFLVIVLWLVSLPRYRVQYEIFKLRKRSGVHEYFDIRMPWTMGWSVFIDILLFAFFSTAIFGTGDFFNVMVSIFGD